VTVEEQVDDLGAPGLNAVILPAWTTSAIAVVPGGAYPSYAQGYYRRANGFYIAWDDISRDRTKFQDWMRANVLGKGPEAFSAYRRRAV
jgi:glutaconate CoA-transferase, subunit A